MSEIWFRRPTAELINTIHLRTAVHHLGIEFTEVGDDHMTARLPADERTVQPYGIIHGGVSMVLAETLGSTAGAACVDPATHRVFGQEINANHLRPTSNGWISGTARPFHLGRTSQVWGIEIANEAGKLTCVARITMAVIASPASTSR